MRILLTVHQFLPDSSAGTEIVLAAAARELMRRGHTLRIFCGRFDPSSRQVPDEARFDRYEFEGIPVHRFTHVYVPMGGERNIARLEHDNPLARRFFASLLDEFKPDIVHAYHLSRLSSSPLAACQTARIPVVFTATDFWIICPQERLMLPDGRLCPGPSWNAGNCIQHLALMDKTTPLRKALYRLPSNWIGAAAGAVRTGWLPFVPQAGFVAAMSNRPQFLLDRLAMVHTIVVPSQTVGRLLAANGIAASRILCLPNGIDVRHIPRLAGKAGSPNLRVGFIGTLAPHKGAHILLDAMRRLPPAAPIEISLHGSTDSAPDYAELLHKLAGDDRRIRFAGTFAHENIGQILSEMDVLVVPSVWHENTPTVMYEARAAGCAIVASDLGGMAEMVRPGVDGLLFPAGDVAELAAILIRLYDDRGLARRLAENAPTPPSVENQVTQLESLYRRAIAATGQPPLPIAD